MFDQEEWTVLVQRLVQLTRAGNVPWQESPNGGMSATVSGTDYYLASVDKDERPPYVLMLGDPEELRTFARLESEPLPDNNWEEDRTTGANLLPELYTLAYRHAKGAGDLLLRLLRGLDSLEG